MRRLVRFRLSPTLLLLAVLASLAPRGAFAQTGQSSDRDGVMIWTSVVVVGALLLTSVGYLYRRMRGMDHPTPDEIEMADGGHGHADDASGHESEGVLAHPEAEPTPMAAHH